MQPIKRTTKEKILAVLTAVILFLFVGSLFAYIGILNVRATEKLQEEVRLQKIEALEKKHFDSFAMAELLPNEITAKSFITLLVNSKNGEKVLGSKNSDNTSPIASITKLMTAVIVIENIDLNTKVTATKNYVGGDGTMKVLEIGKTYTAKELLSNMLIASDNDAAQLLAGILGTTNFVSLMNAKAKELDLLHTHYVNPTGLDPIDEKILSPFNVSSARDLAMLMNYINTKYPNIFAITRNSSYNFCDISNDCKVVLSTDELLNDPNFKLKIIGSKTGQTIIAEKNLALILAPFDGIFLINVVLGSEDHFADTRAIINHLKFN